MNLEYKCHDLERLHRALDELLASYLCEHLGSLPSQISVLELLEWNYERIQAAKVTEYRNS